jgi:hypothetical protein
MRLADPGEMLEVLRLEGCGIPGCFAAVAVRALASALPVSRKPEMFCKFQGRFENK